MKKASSLLVPALLLGLSAAIVQSCASGETDPAFVTGSGGDSGDGSGGDSGDGSGGRTGSGGAGTSSGGTPASSGGSSSGGVKGSGGSTGTSSGGAKGSGGVKGSGGTTGTSSGGKVGSGGTTIITGTGGTVVITGSGGTTAVACTKQDSTMTVTNGMATNGTWSGYAYTYVGSTPATITPACGSTGTCFTTAAKQLCVTGTVGPDPSFGASAGFGWDIGGTASSGAAGRSGSSGGAKPAISPGGTGLAYNVPGITTSMRIQVEDAAGNDYCATVPTANMGTIPWGSFTEKCYNSPPGTAYTSATKITSVQIVVPTTSGSMATTFCFCVLSMGSAG